MLALGEGHRIGRVGHRAHEHAAGVEACLAVAVLEPGQVIGAHDRLQRRRHGDARRAQRDLVGRGRRRDVEAGQAIAPGDARLPRARSPPASGPRRHSPRHRTSSAASSPFRSPSLFFAAPEDPIPVPGLLCKVHSIPSFANSSSPSPRPRIGVRGKLQPGSITVVEICPAEAALWKIDFGFRRNDGTGGLWFNGARRLEALSDARPFQCAHWPEQEPCGVRLPRPFPAGGGSTTRRRRHRVPGARRSST